MLLCRYSPTIIPAYIFSSRFGQYGVGDDPSTLDVIRGILTHPKELVLSLLTPFDKRVKYFSGQWLPLAYIPALSASAWILSGFPLLELLMQQGESPLAISNPLCSNSRARVVLRHSFVVVPTSRKI